MIIDLWYINIVRTICLLSCIYKIFETLCEKQASVVCYSQAAVTTGSCHRQAPVIMVTSLSKTRDSAHVCRHVALIPFLQSWLAFLQCLSGNCNHLEPGREQMCREHCPNGNVVGFPRVRVSQPRAWLVLRCTSASPFFSVSLTGLQTLFRLS